MIVSKLIIQASVKKIEGINIGTQLFLLKNFKQ